MRRAFFKCGNRDSASSSKSACSSLLNKTSSRYEAIIVRDSYCSVMKSKALRDLKEENEVSTVLPYRDRKNKPPGISAIFFGVFFALFLFLCAGGGLLFYNLL